MIEVKFSEFIDYLNRYNFTLLYVERKHVYIIFCSNGAVKTRVSKDNDDANLLSFKALINI